jgi:hypothetical protein
MMEKDAIIDPIRRKMLKTGAGAAVHGNRWRPGAIAPVKAGRFIYEPSGGNHYDMAKDEK